MENLGKKEDLFFPSLGYTELDAERLNKSAKFLYFKYNRKSDVVNEISNSDGLPLKDKLVIAFIVGELYS